MTPTVMPTVAFSSSFSLVDMVPAGSKLLSFQAVDLLLERLARGRTKQLNQVQSSAQQFFPFVVRADATCVPWHGHIMCHIFNQAKDTLSLTL